jgi:hypothetical protein
MLLMGTQQALGRPPPISFFNYFSWIIVIVFPIQLLCCPFFPPEDHPQLSPHVKLGAATHLLLMSTQPNVFTPYPHINNSSLQQR